MFLAKCLSTGAAAVLLQLSSVSSATICQARSYQKLILSGTFYKQQSCLHIPLTVSDATNFLPNIQIGLELRIFHNWVFSTFYFCLNVVGFDVQASSSSASLPNQWRPVIWPDVNSGVKVCRRLSKKKDRKKKNDSGSWLGLIRLADLNVENIAQSFSFLIPPGKKKLVLTHWLPTVS